jgi:hypothetical protein
VRAFVGAQLPRPGGRPAWSGCAPCLGGDLGALALQRRGPFADAEKSPISAQTASRPPAHPRWLSLHALGRPSAPAVLSGRQKVTPKRGPEGPQARPLKSAPAHGGREGRLASVTVRERFTSSERSWSGACWPSWRRRRALPPAARNRVGLGVEYRRWPCSFGVAAAWGLQRVGGLFRLALSALRSQSGQAERGEGPRRQ